MPEHELPYWISLPYQDKGKSHSIPMYALFYPFHPEYQTKAISH
jgi:hypothetical protein